MDVEALRCRPLRRLAGLPGPLWLTFHVLLYLGVGAVGIALWDVRSGAALSQTLAAMLVGVLWFSPLVVFVSVAATFCLGVLRLLTTARWYWFRLAAVLLFAVPFPLLVLGVNGPETALPVAAVQLATALLIVQPRRGSDGWADRDPVMRDHHW
ncbi:hypothetical protein C6361_01640 [Plantactinospora sp. BC1]|uniref:hypothetical protein n=1 Tax=Plantactinospora sp. BC1 TaxID=2108470 RepID=UPI000D1691FB|nr:hypothetical protein [Plantactinospora sp. BC1]AVT28412.1 hypothetical protein C6361_01640 [Plantactinospora sp. BC1]